ncbi:hypothetical protein [Shewanella youngdeokensis]|uniref:Uncharacterized protein n=1 Tax=Shewanella youngdeokensis TaxID=2999068 RepID=A0ABZ0JZ52_9GAMM|nr:hypothetical protein RGE70_01025 [Shewanella sp. DAU334]
MSGTFMLQAHGWIACSFMSGTFMLQAHGWIACSFMSGTFMLQASLTLSSSTRFAKLTQF